MAKEKKPFITTDRQRSEKEQISFFEKCFDGFKKAVSNTKEKNFFYLIADTKIKISFAGNSLVPDLTPALEHLRIDNFDDEELNICVWDSDSTSVEAPPRPCDWNDFTDRGDIWGFNSKRIKTAFHWIECSVNVMDHESNTAVFWIQNNKQLPFWVHASPFRTIFHWFMEKKGCQLLHAASVGTKKNAVLITGKGGVGKSTTALNCLSSGLLYLADDYLITKLEPEPKVYSLYNTAKLNADNIQNFPEFTNLVTNPDKLDQEKAIIYLYPDYKDKIINELPLKAILVPKITDKEETNISKPEKWEVVRSISFTTMSQLPNVGINTHNFINSLTSNIPSFNLELGNNFKQIHETIVNLINNPERFNITEESNIEISKKSLEKPLITVIVPVFNGEKFIKEALENIISQNYHAIEIIVVNDGSTDNTEKIINEFEYDIRLFNNNENCGPSLARNKGIRDASGEFIAFLDVDDLWPENNLMLLLNEMCSNPQLEVVHGFAQVMKLNKESNVYEYVGGPKDSFKHYIGAGIYKKNVFNKVGLFNENLKFGEDEDWYRRAYETGAKIKRLDDTTLFVRRHESNMTKDRNFVELNALKVFKMSLDRRRSETKK